jgi:hypothetical protein
VYVSTPSGCRIYSGVADNDYAPQLNGVPVLNKPAGDNPLWSPEKPPSNNGVPLWGGGKPAPDLDAALVWKPIWGSWGPDPSTVCLGEEFQQTRTHPTYGVEYRTAIGAREPIPIWDFDTPSGKTVSNFNILHSSQTLEVIWGDGSDSQVESGVNYAHTYL